MASSITITQTKESLEVTVKHWLIHDVFERAVQIVSGNSIGFNSEFFGLTDHGYASDGCGALNSITNGYQLRTIDNEITVSLRELLDWASARYGIGWGFEKDYNNEYRLRVEPMEHFYQDGEILDLGDPISIKQKGSYKESTFNPLLINRIDIGYQKFSPEIGINNIFEDFLTRSQYSMPISTIKGNYAKISPFICSNDLIQATYDARLNLGKSWKYDEDNFIIAIVRSASDFVPENDENFTTVTGLDDKASAYNIRHAPSRMVLEHSLLTNSTLMGKSLNDEYQNTTALINTSFNSLFTPGESCKLGDIQRLSRSATGNIPIGDNFVGLRLWNPIQHTLTVAMTKIQLDLIIDAMENNATDSSKNLGYLTYRNNEGAVKSGWIMQDGIIWNPNDEIAEITTLERADNYAV